MTPFPWHDIFPLDSKGPFKRLRVLPFTYPRIKSQQQIKALLVSIPDETTRMGGKTMGEANFNFYRRGGQVGGLKKALEDDKEVEMWKDWVKHKVEETGLPIQIPDC